MTSSSTVPFGAGQSGNNNERNDMTQLEESFLNVLGPSGYEQHPDKKAKFRHSRLHIPDRLPEKYLGKNNFMQERVDGLITDTTFSPFTTVILPYHHMDTPDQKIEWKYVRVNQTVIVP
jgi:hypothetical protein